MKLDLSAFKIGRTGKVLAGILAGAASLATVAGTAHEMMQKAKPAQTVPAPKVPTMADLEAQDELDYKWRLNGLAPAPSPELDALRAQRQAEMEAATAARNRDRAAVAQRFSRCEPMSERQADRLLSMVEDGKISATDASSLAASLACQKFQSSNQPDPQAKVRAAENVAGSLTGLFQTQEHDDVRKEIARQARNGLSLQGLGRVQDVADRAAATERRAFAEYYQSRGLEVPAVGGGTPEGEALDILEMSLNTLQEP